MDKADSVGCDLGALASARRLLSGAGMIPPLIAPIRIRGARAAEVWWSMPSEAAHAGSELPDIDDRLVEPETPYEMLDGELVYVSPPLDASGHIEDPALEVPLPLEAILHAAKADDAIARASLARHNPVLEARLAEHHDEGVREGLARGVEQGLARGVEQGLARGVGPGVAHAARALAEAVLAVRAARGIAVGEAERVRIVDERDLARLERWLVGARRAPTHTSCGR